jgi:hypothetical protein
MLKDGAAPVQIKAQLNTSYYNIRRYSKGDPLLLCRFTRGSSPLDEYRAEIIELLKNNVQYKEALPIVQGLGYTGKMTAFREYCRKIISELELQYSSKRMASGALIDPKFSKPDHHFVSRTTVQKHLWTGSEIDESDWEYIVKVYPQVSLAAEIITAFRGVYSRKCPVLMDKFVSKYSACSLKPIASFASGLRLDWDAVKNSVISKLSNGYVEGNNNRIKLIKRTMYGRAKIDLLRVKVLRNTNRCTDMLG